MRFIPTELDGAFLVELEPHRDDRGYFMRSFAAELWEEAGLDPTVVHVNLSGNTHEGTVRGLHYQAPPWSEPKTVHCIQGRVWDVIVDVRPESATYMRWQSFDLAQGTVLFIPPGFAHGFQTLDADSTILYLMGAVFSPEAARGIHYHDPALGIEWPAEASVISDTDRSYPFIDEDWDPTL